MATLSGNKIKDTYQSLIKLTDNGNLTTGAKRITDGFGNNSPLFLSTTQIGVGVTPTVQFHASGDGKFGGNLTVTGNLVVEGSLTTVGTDTLTVKDPLIVLANNNTSTDAVDIGFYGKYNPSGTTLFAGLFRDESDDKFKLFKSLQVEPTTTVNTSGTGYTAAGLVIGGLEATTGLFSGDVTFNEDVIIAQGDASDRILFTRSAHDSFSLSLLGAQGLTITNVTDGTTDLQFSGSGNATFGGDITVSGGDITLGGTGRIQGIDTVSASTDAANKAYVDSQIAANNELSEVLTNGNTTGGNNIVFGDSATIGTDDTLIFGAGNDLRIAHNGTDSVIRNFTGGLFIDQELDDGDITFRSDDGSGGKTTYYFLDGSTVMNRFLQHVQLDDNIELRLGTNQDLRLEHTGSNGTITNFTGSLTIQNNTDDSDIIFKSDDGSGGTENYIQIDGSEGRTLFNKNVRLNDSVELQIGSSADLKIYHSSGNTFLQNGTGSLVIEQASGAISLRPKTGENGVLIIEDGAVELYHDNSKKLETTSTGVTVTGATNRFVVDSSSASAIDIGFISSARTIRAIETGGGNARPLTILAQDFTFKDDSATRLTIDSTNATFAGDVIINGSHLTLANGTTDAQSTDYLYIGGTGLASANAAIYIGNDGDGGGYGYRIFYEGTGSGNNNKLIFKSENLGSPVDMLSFTADGNATFAGNVDVNGTEITVGTNNSIFAENNIRFKSTGGAFIDHNTTGQSISFRTSVSSSLDTTPLVLSGANATFAGNVTTTGSTIKVDNSASASYVVDRGNDTSGATFEYFTNGTIKWFTGLRGVSSEDFYFFNYGTGATAIQIEAANSNTTFAGDITIGGKTYPKLNLTDNQGVARNFSVGTNNETFTVRNETGSADAFTIAGADNATTFAGTVDTGGNITASTSGNTFVSSVSTSTWAGMKIQASDSDSAYLFLFDTSGERARIQSTSNNDIKFSTNGGGSLALTLDSSTNATFEGNVTGGNGTFTNLTINATEKLRFDGAGGHTYIEEDSNDTLIFATGGTTRLTLDANATFSGVALFSDGNGINFGNSNAKIYGSSANGIQFNGGGSEKMRLTQTGELGIGVTAPASDVHIVGTSNDTVSQANANLNVEGAGGNGLVVGTIASSPYSTYIQSGFVDNFSTAVYPLALNPLGGNIGIGTTSPDFLTHLYSTGNSVLGITAGTSAFATLQFGRTSDTTRGAIEYSTSDDSLRLKTGNNSERMRITSGGIVGIGTSSPNSGVKLEVNGIISANGDNAPTGGGLGWGDYQTGGYKWIQSFESQQLRINPLGNDVFFPASSVGIGITSATAGSALTLNSSGSTGMTMISQNVNGECFINFADADDTNAGQIFYGHQDNKMVFRVNDANRLTIDNAGQAIFLGDVTLDSDSTKLKLGDSQDLQIYHDGNDSYISDVGTGLLFIRASSAIRLQGANGESSIDANENGAVNLYYDNVKKFETTSAGISVTGSTTVSGDFFAGDLGDPYLIFADQSASTVYLAGDVQVGSSGSSNLYFGNTISASSSNRGMRIHTNNANVFFDFQGEANDELFFRDYDGSGGIHTRHEFGISNGAIIIAGSLTQNGSPSDIKYKENIKTISNGIDKIEKLNPVEFDWNDKSDAHKIGKKEDAGFIAQEVQKVLPNLVNENVDGDLVLNYEGIIPYLVQSIQELQERIKQLETN